ncbi:DUF2637 domain-containing protein [Streptomyces sp. NPDC088727]|uniref:DUF2637 domain-containing protein n=1 Tax=Streptomyces sp. NPDC088727 TaxID=3365875 RepID=UPI00380E4190
MAQDQDTRTDSAAPASESTLPKRYAQFDWDNTLTDGLIYLLALGGFYVIFQTLYSLALSVGIPRDQAIVVASLADLAILAYSRKAVQEVNAGRSAWGIRLIVAALSLGTFTLQIRSAWPDPVSVGFHTLPATVWIIGHEMMLRGKLRDAKKQRRDHEIAQGLRPAPLPTIRTIWWILDPRSTFKVWRLSKLWEMSQDAVIRMETSRLQEEGESIPRAWQGVTLISVEPKRLESADEEGTELEKKLQQDRQKADACSITLYRKSDSSEKVTYQSMLQFLGSIPPAPAEGRPVFQAMQYLNLVEEAAERADIKTTGLFLSALLGVGAPYISRLRKMIREEETKELASAGS